MTSERPVRLHLPQAPLSFNQEYTWFIDQLLQGANNVQLVLDMRGVLDHAALERGLAEVIGRHEILRSVIRVVDDQPMQCLAPDSAVVLPVVDTDRLEDRLAEQAAAPFDLSRGPLWRATLFRISESHHCFAATVHHIAGDTRSCEILEEELLAAYQAFAEGRAPSLPEPPIQYADFSVWQRQVLSGERLEKLLDFWQRELADVPHAPGPLSERPRGVSREQPLPPALVQRLLALGRARGCTPFVCFLTALVALLHRYSGERDIVVGTPVSSRGSAELDSVVGCFVNPLMVRSRVAGDPSFRQLLSAVRDSVLQVLTYREAPIDRIVQRLNPARGTDILPWYQVEMHVGDERRRPKTLSGLQIERRGQGWTSLHLRLAFNVAIGDEGARILVSYDAAAFAAETISSMTQHLERLIASALEDPERPISRLAYLSEAEVHRLTADATRRAEPSSSLHGLIAQAAAAQPDGTALIYREQHLSYLELEERADRAARHLVDRGIGRGSIVGVAIGRCLDQVVALLAVLKAGAAWLPLEPGGHLPVETSDPEARLQRLADVARPSLVLTAEGLHEAIAASGQAELPAVTSDDAAYIIYTSGSTGRPKGVIGLHRGAVNRVSCIQDQWPFAPGEVACHSTSLGFVDAVASIFAPLAAGVPLVVIDDETLRDPELFVGELARQRITRIVVVPSFASVIIAVPGVAERLPALHWCTVSGETLAASLADWFFAALAGRRLLNLYGSSEVSADVTGGEMTPDQPVTIGRPLANCRVYVLDEALAPLPVGVTGELFVAGSGLARGYLDQPALTAERFLPDPFARGERMYRTGDRGRWRLDGSLELVGRVDRQVKVRGVRVELGDVEAALMEHAAVSAAAVIAREVDVGDTRLAAWVVSSPEVDVAELRRHMLARLPRVAVPSPIVRLPELPRLPSGKLDRAALPAPADCRHSPEYLPPANDDEIRLARLWQELLGIPRVGRDDDFFALGGHSLLAARAAARVRRELGVPLAVRTFFEAPTVREVAAEVQRLRASAAAPLPPIQRRARAELLPFLRSQIGHWSERPSFLWFGCLRGDFDRESLQQAMAEVFRRHAILRATLRQLPDRTVEQRLLPWDPRPLQVQNLPGLPPLARAEAVEAAQQAAASTPMDPAIGPLFRAQLLCFDEDQVLLMAGHHAVFDGRSWSLLLEELDSAYRALVAGRTPELPPLPFDAFDFAAWQAELAAGNIGQAGIEWWNRNLDGASPVRLPAPAERRQRVEAQRVAVRGSRFRCTELRWSYEKEMVERLRAACLAERSTLQMGMLAMWLQSLHHATGQSDLVLSIVDEGRHHAGMERLIGPFFQRLPLRVRLEQAASNRELLALVRTALLDARDHADVPLPPRPERLTRIGFNYHEIYQGGLGNLAIEPLPVPPRSSIGDFDLNLNLGEHDDGHVSGLVRFNAELLEEDAVRQLVADLERRLRLLPTS